MRPFARATLEDGNGYPSISTGKATAGSTTTEATLNGSVAASGLRAVSEYGFVYGTSPDPVIGGAGVTKIVKGGVTTSGPGAFAHTLTGLTVDTIYYGRTYAITAAGTYYDDVVSNSDQAFFSGLTIETYTIAGGGAGGSGTDRTSGGGGAGGVLFETYVKRMGDSGSALVGAGGATSNGTNSYVFGSVTYAVGGGLGGYRGTSGYVNGNSGGSGGGGQHNPSSTYGSGTAGQGNRGGEGYDSGSVSLMFGGGGGGGSSSVGGTASSSTTGRAGAGGSGTTLSAGWFSSSVSFGGGGGGGAQYGTSAPNYLGGQGVNGGGSGGRNTVAGTGATSGGNGSANTGGGGGGSAAGGSTTAMVGGNGGSGAIFLRILNLPYAYISMGVGISYNTGTAVDGGVTYKWYRIVSGIGNPTVQSG